MKLHLTRPGGQSLFTGYGPGYVAINDQQYRLRRGGSFTYEASYQRSAHRGRPDGYVPNERRDSVGFRIGRTYR